MIGQIKLLNKIDILIEHGFPRFLILTGKKGQGKKTLVKEIAKKLNYTLVKLNDIKIDDIRTIIDLAYNQTEPIIYLISDADKMSIGAKNSLLKVIEEPPNNAYFIITLEDINNTLPTIKSRCQELKMDLYTIEELNKFIQLINCNISDLERTILLDICSNYYEIELINNYGILEFYNYVKKVVDNIYRVQSANSFKLTEKLAIKDDEDKYDIRLFLETFKSICLNNALNYIDSEDKSDIEIFENYLKSISITSDIIDDLKINGINKQSLLDIWILNIRSLWRD